MSVQPKDEAEQVWRLLVSLVMETRGPWRRKVSEATGLSFSRVRALKRLQKAPMTLGELAEEMSIDAPAATVLANDLEARGLVQRQVHPENRRAKLVSVTAAGRQMLARLGKVDDPPPEAIATLPASQLTRLRQALLRATAPE